MFVHAILEAESSELHKRCFAVNILSLCKQGMLRIPALQYKYTIMPDFAELMPCNAHSIVFKTVPVSK